MGAHRARRGARARACATRSRASATRPARAPGARPGPVCPPPTDHAATATAPTRPPGSPSGGDESACAPDRAARRPAVVRGPGRLVRAGDDAVLERRLRGTSCGVAARERRRLAGLGCREHLLLVQRPFQGWGRAEETAQGGGSCRQRRHPERTPADRAGDLPRASRRGPVARHGAGGPWRQRGVRL